MESETPGVPGCLNPEVFESASVNPPAIAEPRRGPPAPIPLKFSFEEMSEALAPYFPFLESDIVGVSGGGFVPFSLQPPHPFCDPDDYRQYHAYSENMRALLHLEGNCPTPSVARLYLFDQHASPASHHPILEGFLKPLGFTPEVMTTCNPQDTSSESTPLASCILDFLGTTTAEASQSSEFAHVKRRIWTRDGYGVVVTVNGDYGMATVDVTYLAGEYVFDTLNSTISLGPNQDRGCLLTFISGKFHGSGEKFKINEIDNEFFLEGQTFQNMRTRVRSRCFPTNSLSPEHTWSQTAQGNDVEVDLGSATNRACFLTGLGGAMEGGGEWIRVFRKDGRWVLTGHSQQPDEDGETVDMKRLSAVARCVDADDVSDEFFDAQDDDAVMRFMTHGPGVVCGLTGLTGKFEGGGESVRIFDSSNDADHPSWWLTVSSQQEDVAARAVCFFPRY